MYQNSTINLHVADILKGGDHARDAAVAKSLFHTYCLIELRTSLALECKSLELNLDELQSAKDPTSPREREGMRGGEGGREKCGAKAKMEVRSFELPSARPFLKNFKYSKEG